MRNGAGGLVVGALAGGVLGAIISVFAGLGGSDAYQETFVSPEGMQVVLVSLHTNDRDEARHGRKRLSSRSWADLFDVDANGKTRHR